MLKKLLCFLLVLLLVLTFAGCKSAETGSNGSSEVFEEILSDGDGNVISKTTESKKPKASSDDGDNAETVITSKTKNDSNEKTGAEKTETKSKSEEKTASKKVNNCSHRWQPATCTKASYCSRCRETKGVPLGHDTEGEPTCTNGVICKRCNAVVKTAIGHCYRKGYCIRCNSAEPDGITAIFLGDSISYGSGEDSDNRLAWAGRIQRDHSIRCDNVSLGGWTLSDRCGGIFNQFENSATDHYDYVIMHGGYNDVFRDDIAPMIDLGKVSPDGTTEFDTSTMAGGMEYLFYKAEQLYPNAKKGFIINYFTDGSERERFNKFVPLAKKICNKWGIKYLDFDEIEGLHKQIIPKLCDGVHPTAEGYELLTPYIYNWMMTL